MVKHNNKISNGHFRKHWQSFVKTWFDQPARKIRRRKQRSGKEKTFISNSAYNNKFFPLIHCPTRMYNMRIRFGRGFSLGEINNAKLTKNYANSIGIKVDKRRKRKSLFEKYNTKRLADYLNKILLTKKNKKKDEKDEKIYPLSIKNSARKNLTNYINFKENFKKFIEEDSLSNKHFLSEQ